MSKATIKAEVDANIKQNGVQAITGNILNSVLNDMVDEIPIAALSHGNVQGVAVDNIQINDKDGVVYSANAPSYKGNSVRNYTLLYMDGTTNVFAGDNYEISDYIDVSKFSSISFSGLLYTTGTPYAGLVLYAENKATKVAAFQIQNGNISLADYPTAKWMRCCYDNREKSKVSVYYDGRKKTLMDKIGVVTKPVEYGKIEERNYYLLDVNGSPIQLSGDDYDTSDYISLDGAKSIFCKNLVSFQQGSSWATLCLYDENNSLVAYFRDGSSLNIDLSDYPNARKFRYSTILSSQPKVVVSEIVESCAESIDYANQRISNLEEELANDSKIEKVQVYVGTNETYATIQGAVSAITDASPKKIYTILVREGTYDISNAGINNIPIKPYVNIKGENRNVKVVFKISNYDANKNVFDVASGFDGFAEISNMSFYTSKCKGTLHLDSPDWKGEVYMHDCDIYTYENENPHDTSKDYYMYQVASYGSINTAIHRGQTIRIENIVTNGYIYTHTALADIQDLNSEPSKFIVKGCVCDWIGVYANGEKVRKQAIIEDNKCNFIKISQDDRHKFGFAQWDVILKNNNCCFVQGLYHPYPVVPGSNDGLTNLWDACYQKFMPFADSNLHRVVQNLTGASIPRNTKVNFVNANEQAIELATGSTYDAITCVTIPNGEFGVVQNGGDKDAFWAYIQSHSFEQA